MGKWIIAVVAAALLAGGCGGGYKVDRRVLDAVTTITSADDYDYDDREGAYVVGDRRVVVGWWGGRAYGYEMREDGTKTKLSTVDAAATLAAFEIVSYDLTKRFTALKN